MAVWRDLTNPINIITVALATFVGEMAEHRIYSTANDWLDAALRVAGIPAFLPLLVAVLIVVCAYFRGRHELGKDDPKIYLESVEPGEGMAEALVLRNLGGAEALNVRIAEIQPAETRITFASVPLIPVGEKGASYPTQQNEGTILRHNLTHELKTAWVKRNSKGDTLPVRMRITYENHDKIVFEAQCDLVFNGAKHSASPELWAKEVIQFANWDFKQVGKKHHRQEQM